MLFKTDFTRLYARTILIGLVGCFFAEKSLGQTGCLPVPGGIVGWWRAEGNGTDSIGTNSAILLNGASFAPGEVGQAFQFDGISNAVKVSASPTLNVGLSAGLTVEAWINPSDVSTPRPVFEFDLDSQRTGVQLWVGYPNVGDLTANIIDTNGTWHLLQSSTAAVLTNIFQHVAVTYDKASGLAVLFLDGAIVQQANFGTFTPQTAYDLSIGQRPSAGYFAGLIDELSLYNVALPPNVVQGIYLAGSAGKCVSNTPPVCVPPPSGIVAWWQAESNANDLLGANNGALMNGASFAKGEVGQAFSFNGISQFVQIPDSPALDPTNGMTLEAWVNFSSYSRNDSILIVGKTLPGVFPYMLSALNVGGQWIFRPLIVAANNLAYVNGTTVIQLNTWYHVAMTHDGSVLKLYVNGHLEGFTGAPGSIASSTLPFLMGGYGTGPWSFPGRLDEVSLYARALSAGEIQSIYQAGSAGKCPAIAPFIVSEPNDQTVLAGQSASFSVGAVGTDPLRYQWLLNGSALAGQTSNLLTFSAVQLSDAGAYTVVITNTAGSVTSSPAMLTVVPVPTNCIPAPAGIVGWWPGEGSALDLLGVNNGVLKNGVSFTNGEVGRAFTFDGITQYVQVPDGQGLDPAGALTLECWAYFSTYSSANVVLLVGKTLPGIVQYQLDAVQSGTQWFFRPVVDVANNLVAVNSTNAIQLNAWYHVAMTYNGSALNIYVNGNLEASIAASGQMAPTTLPFLIGGYGTGPWSFAGRLDEVSLYGRALSGAEIQSIYAAGNAGKCPGIAPSIASQPTDQSTLAGGSVSFTASATGTLPLNYQWLFNGAPLPDQTDTSLVLTNVQLSAAGDYSVVVTNSAGSAVSSNAVLTVIPLPTNCVAPPTGIVAWWQGEGNANDALGLNNGTLLNGAPFTNGEVGQAFSFDGVTQALQIPNGPALNPTNGLTLEAWVYFAGFSTLNNIVEIAGKTTQGSVQYELTALNSGTHWVFRPIVNAAGGLVGVNGATAIQLNKWYHVAMTYDGSAIKVYVDGALDGSATLSGAITVTTLPFMMGGYGTGQYGFNGRLDEVTLYNRALSEGEVQAVYSAGPMGKCASIAPSIVMQPTNQTAYTGDTVTFRVEVSGTLPLAYQWLYGNNPIPFGSSSSLTLTNVQLTAAGSYSVVISNSAGVATSSNAVLVVSNSPSRVQVASSQVAAGATVSVPIDLIALGSESAVGFSLNFPTNLLTYIGISQGTGASGAALVANTNKLSSGEIGVALALGTGQSFAPGTQELAVVSFTAVLSSNSATAGISFGDQPTSRALSDALAHPLPVLFDNGEVAIIGAQGFEADVAPRPNGDGVVNVIDWVQVGRFVVGLDSPTNSNEFQRADCAPRATYGDGVLSLADWVQAGRYAAGLDPLTPAAGPTGPSASAIATLASKVPRPKGLARQVQIASACLVKGAPGKVPVYLQSQGNENALGFSIAFDPTVMSFSSATLGSDATSGTLQLNMTEASSGRIACLLALQPGTAFSSGNRQVLNLAFNTAPSANGNYPMIFTNNPVHLEVDDATATVLPANFVSGTATITPLPCLSITSSSATVSLAWPQWATNFVLQQIDALVSPASNWTNSTITLTTTNNQIVTTVPVTGKARFYRLKEQ